MSASEVAYEKKVALRLMGLSDLTVFRNGQILRNGSHFLHSPRSDVVTLIGSARTGDVFEFLEMGKHGIKNIEQHIAFVGQAVFRLGFIPR